MAEVGGEQPVTNIQILCQLEDAAKLFEQMSRDQPPEPVSDAFPTRLSKLTHALTELTSRDDAERLLAVGVNMWNTVISSEGAFTDTSTRTALVRVRHNAVDCMHMGHTVLGGVSSTYNVDELSLLRFYTVCGQQYARTVSDLETAEVCFSKAATFAHPVTTNERNKTHDPVSFARAMFDLLIGRAECEWEKEHIANAERFIRDARPYLKYLPRDHEFLASIEYNFGLFLFKRANMDSALVWLKQSIDTRDSDANKDLDAGNQARTMRLAGVCLLKLQQYDESWTMMKNAEELCHDPMGAYLLAKLCIITKKSNCLDIVLTNIRDETFSLQHCMNSISLLINARRMSDASTAYAVLSERYKDSVEAIVCTIGPQRFEVLVSLGKVSEALSVLRECCEHIAKLPKGGENVNEVGSAGKEKDNEKRKEEDSTDGRNENSQGTHFSRWAVRALAAGSELASRNEFAASADVFDQSLRIAREGASRLSPPSAKDIASAKTFTNIVLQNEGSICQMASSCALNAIEEMKKSHKVIFDDANRSDDKEEERKTQQDRMMKLVVEHGERAKEMKPTSFAPRLLLFRANLLKGEFERAAGELCKARAEIESFDPGAVAEAACEANNVGSTECVVAALRCVISMDERTLRVGGIGGSGGLPRGFYGVVLLSCVKIMRGGHLASQQSGDEAEAKDDASTAWNEEFSGAVLEVMRDGVKGVKALGLEESIEDSGAQYLANLCWNEGKEAGEWKSFKLWEGWFDVCYEWCTLLEETAETAEMRCMSKVMMVCAIVQSGVTLASEYERARVHIREARVESQLLQTHRRPNEEEDPIEGMLLFFEAQCAVQCNDLRGLESVTGAAIATKVSARALEQIAAVTYSWMRTEDNGLGDGEQRSRCLDLTCALLEKATKVRLSEETVKIAELAVTMREHVELEMTKGLSWTLALPAFRRAAEVAVEMADEYAEDEYRWLVSVGWDRAQMEMRVGKLPEAKAWALATQYLVASSARISSCRPRLDAMLADLGDIDATAYTMASHR